MKKVFLSAILGIFVLAGTGLVLSASETAKSEKASCCSSTVTALADASESIAVAKEGCSDVSIEKASTASAAKAGCGDAASASAAKAGCGDSAKASASTVKAGCGDAASASTVKAGCGDAASASAVKAGCTDAAKASAGECVKRPAGVNTTSAQKD